MVSNSDVEKVIVVRPGVAVPANGARLHNDATGTFNQAIGGIGAYVDVAGSSNPAAMTPGSYAGQPFRFIQVRDTSKDKAPLFPRTLEESQYIHGNCRIGLEIAGQPYSEGSVNTWLLGAPNGSAAGAISVQSLNTYTLNATAYGYRTMLYNGSGNSPSSQGRFESPDWTTTTISTAANRRDFTVKSLVRDFNRKNSGLRHNKFGFAIALDTAGTSLAGITVADAIAGGVGSVVTIGFEGACQPVNVTLTADRFAALEALEAYAIGTLGLSAGDLKIAPYSFVDSGCATATQATGTITITDLDNLATDTFTINGEALVEGTDWNRGAAGVNGAATALAAAINALDGVSASATAAVITVTSDRYGVSGNSITMAYTDGGTVGATLSGATLTGGAGVEVAGAGDSEADMIFLVAMDDETAYYDEVPNTRRRLQVSVNEGNDLPTVQRVEITLPNEGEGDSRRLRLMYENEEHYRSYTSSKSWGANHVAYSDEILDGEVYDIYTIHHCHNRTSSTGSPTTSPHTTTIAIVNTERAATASTFSSNGVNPQKTYIESVINAVADYYGMANVNL